MCQSISYLTLPPDILTYKKYSPLFMAALLTIAKLWKRPEIWENLVKVPTASKRHSTQVSVTLSILCAQCAWSIVGAIFGA